MYNITTSTDDTAEASTMAGGSGRVLLIPRGHTYIKTHISLHCHFIQDEI